MDVTAFAVDDDPDMLALISEVGDFTGVAVESFQDAKDFQQAIKAKVVLDEHPLVVLDIVMPDVDGLELLKWFAENHIDAQLVLMSGYDDAYLNMAESLAKAYGLEVVSTLTKPFSIAQLQKALHSVIIGNDGDAIFSA